MALTGCAAFQNVCNRGEAAGPWLHSTLKPGGVLFSSNPRGRNEEGWNMLHCQPRRHAFGNGSYRRPLATGMASRTLSALGSVVPGAKIMAPAFSGAWGCPRFSSPPPPDWLTEPDCLPAGVDVHMLDDNYLLPLPSIAQQCL